MEIPVPPKVVIRDVGTQKDKLSYCWISTSKYVGRRDRQIRFFDNPEIRWGAKISSEVAESTLSRKATIETKVPVPQTDTGRQGENPKMSGRTIVKELGKMSP